mmetsp:Transcript_2227/g.5786  ORF Transcript_2227/g.5786 Transcript_2227/m.5786 type:complete len:325 (+) Transcript_2227:609-1583(+)
MHIQRRADAVAGAVAVVEAHGPQRRARHGVDRDAGRARREHRGGQRDVALQHGGEGGDLVRAGRACVYGACDVGGAAVVLAARVDEQHAVCRDCATGALRGAVVNDGAVGTFARNGGEARLLEARLLCAQAGDVGVDVHLSQGGPRRHLLLQEAQELGDRDAVAQVRLHHALHLCLVLNGFGHADGRGGLHDGDLRLAHHLLAVHLALGALGRRVEGRTLHRVAHFGGVHRNLAAAGREHLDVLQQLLVRLHFHLALAQVLLRLRRQLLAVHVQRQLALLQQQVRHKHGVALDVRAAQVDAPRNLVQHCHQQAIRPRGLHLLTQ